MDKKVIYYFSKITLLTLAFILVINFATGFFDNFNFNFLNNSENKSKVIETTKADQNSENFIESGTKDLIIAPV
jgi:hypothetical protein